MSKVVDKFFWDLINAKEIKEDKNLVSELKELSTSVTGLLKEKKSKEIASVLWEMWWKLKAIEGKITKETANTFKKYTESVKKVVGQKDSKVKVPESRKVQPKPIVPKAVSKSEKSNKYWVFSTFFNEIQSGIDSLDSSIQHVFSPKKEAPLFVREIWSTFDEFDNTVQYFFWKYIPFLAWWSIKKELSPWGSESKEQSDKIYNTKKINKKIENGNTKWKSKEEILTWLWISSRLNFNPNKEYSQEEFSSLIWPIAQEIQTKFWVPKDIVIAQALLESSDGNSELIQDANNIFWIKSWFWWKGWSHILEEEWGSTKYKKYTCLEQCFYDYWKYLQQSKFKSLKKLDVTDVKWWANWLEKTKFVNEEWYANSLLSLVNAQIPKNTKDKKQAA